MKLNNSEQAITKSLESIFSRENYNIVFEEDNLSIVSLETNINVCQIPFEDLGPELEQIREYEEYLTVGDSFFNTTVNLESISSNVKKIDFNGLYQGSIEKDQLPLGLILLNASYTIDITKVDNNQEKPIEDLLNDDLFIITVTRDGLYDLLSSETKNRTPEEIFEEIDKIIYSILAQISYEHRLLFKYPRNSNKTEIETIESSREILEITYKKSNDLEPLLYFLAAEEMEYPHLKYLEYYHVLEYYFDHIRIKKIDGIINKLVSIRLQSKSYFNDSYYNEFSSLMSYHADQQSKKGEESRLTEILTEMIGYDLITSSHILPEYKFLASPTLEIEETKFSRLNDVYDIQTAQFRTELTDSKKDAFCQELGRRIYRIRNFIVHTKKFERKNIFVPNQKNYEDLNKDIKLLRGIAYLMITTYEFQ